MSCLSRFKTPCFKLCFQLLFLPFVLFLFAASSKTVSARENTILPNINSNCFGSICGSKAVNLKTANPKASNSKADNLNADCLNTAPLIAVSLDSNDLKNSEKPQKSKKEAVDEKNLFSKDAVILFQGDSITDGNRGRNQDPNHILGHGYAFLLGSGLGARNAEMNWTFHNRGISGNTVIDLKNRWKNDAIDLRPDFLSILIGVNDLGRGVSPEDFARQYEELLTETKKSLPDVQLILIEPFVVSDDVKRCETMKKYQKTVRSLAKQFDAVFVPTQILFDQNVPTGPNPKYWCWDGVHPTSAGHWLIYESWINSVAEYIQEKSSSISSPAVSTQTDSTQTVPNQTDSTQTVSNQTDSTQTDSTQAVPNQTDSTQTVLAPINLFQTVSFTKISSADNSSDEKITDEKKAAESNTLEKKTTDEKKVVENSTAKNIPATEKVWTPFDGQANWAKIPVKLPDFKTASKEELFSFLETIYSELPVWMEDAEKRSDYEKLIPDLILSVCELLREKELVGEEALDIMSLELTFLQTRTPDLNPLAEKLFQTINETPEFQSLQGFSACSYFGGKLTLALESHRLQEADQIILEIRDFILKYPICDAVFDWLLTSGHLEQLAGIRRVKEHKTEAEVQKETDQTVQKICEELMKSDDYGLRENAAQLLGKRRFRRLVGSPLEIQGVNLDGDVLDWDKYRGKVVLIDVWATWCPHCVAMFPHLKEFYEKNRERGFEVISYSIDKNLDALKTFLQKETPPWTTYSSVMTLRKKLNDIDYFYRFDGYPTVILVDKKGNVVKTPTWHKIPFAEIEKLLNNEPIDSALTPVPGSGLNNHSASSVDSETEFSTKPASENSPESDPGYTLKPESER